MTHSKTHASVWERLSKVSWRRILPGVGVIGLVILARALGLLESIELKALDAFLRLRPAEHQDPRILIVGIDETDIQQTGTYPIPDAQLADLIETLSEYNPRAIGMDIYRDLPVDPGGATLATILATAPHVIGVEKITANSLIPPPPSLPPERTGFVDFPLDQDGFVRRTFLGALPSLEAQDPDRFRFSLALKLAEAHLAAEGMPLENGWRNPENMRFGPAELFQVRPNSGGYIGVESGAVQMLINPRSGKRPFAVVSMTDVLSGQVDADLMRDRTILIGITSLSVKDIVNSAAINADNPGLVTGVEMHAHITSQILSAALDDRPLLRVWGDGWEYAWIVFWGGLGMLLVYYVPRPSWYVLAVAVIGLGLVILSLGLLWWGGWWVPVVPLLIGFVINGCLLPGFYFYDQTLRSRIDERQRVIEETYDAIHNGPLQMLALLLREKDTLEPTVGTRLENLNRELRQVYERLLQESRPQGELLQIGDQFISLDMPLHQALYKVYDETLKRDFPGFGSIQFQVVEFEPLQAEGLSVDEKRSLCRFLEEAICNVGKHALEVKQLTVMCLATKTENLIRVEDDGKAEVAALKEPNTFSEQKSKGRGTQQARILARRLRGTFRRSSDQTGTACELRWPLSGANSGEAG